MDFFDKLGKKMGEVYQGAKSKTEEVSQEFKLKSEISKRKNAIEKLYAEMGRIVYEDIKDNKDVSRDVVEAKCAEITANYEEIARLEGEILKVKSIRVCEKCKAEIDYSVEYCPKCGAKQPTDVEVKEEAPSAAEETAAEVNDVNNDNNNY
jgi:hypothetical protein